MQDNASIKYLPWDVVRAVSANDIDKIKGYLAKGLDLHIPSPGMPLVVAAAVHGHVEMMELLLENSADINAQRQHNGFTALMQAVFNDKMQAVKLLLDWGADKSIKDFGGNTALSLAIEFEKTDMETILRDTPQKPLKQAQLALERKEKETIRTMHGQIRSAAAKRPKIRFK